jgi:hypothetical protein
MWLDDVGQCIPDECQDVIVGDAVEDAPPLTPTVHEMGRVQDLQACRNGRHPFIKPLSEFRDAVLLLRQQHEQLQPRHVCEGAEHGRNGFELNVCGMLGHVINPTIH